MTSTSPGARSSGSSSKCPWWSVPLSRVGDEHQHAVARDAALLGGTVRLAQLAGRQRERDQAGTSTISPAR